MEPSDKGKRPWWKLRVPLAGLLDAQRRVPVPRYAQGIGYTFGSLALTSFAVLVITGILLSVYYTPTVDHANDSIQHIESAVPFGAVVRHVHQWSANLMVVFVVLHMGRAFYTGAYRPPREATWLLGVVLLLAVVAAGFFGYALPWDQRGYWATQVGTNLIGEAARVPLIGGLLAPLAAGLRTMLLGGEEVGQATLTRFYSLHILIIPAIIMGVVAAHFALVRAHKMSPPVWDKEARVPKSDEWGDVVRPFYPNHVGLDAAVGFVFVGLMIILAANVPVTSVFEPWSSADEVASLSAPADPLRTPSAIQPEWYYMWIFYLLKVVPPWVGFLLIPGALIASLVALPFVAPRVPWTVPRWGRLGILAGLAGMFLLLTYLGGV